MDPQRIHGVRVASACKIVALMQQADGKLLARVAAHFAESVKLKQQAAEGLGAPIAKAARLLAESLKNGGHPTPSGNRRSPAPSQPFPAGRAYSLPPPVPPPPR